MESKLIEKSLGRTFVVTREDFGIVNGGFLCIAENATFFVASYLGDFFLRQTFLFRDCETCVQSEKTIIFLFVNQLLIIF